MGRLFVGGGIGVVAFAAGWLLFAAGAAAQPSPLPFTVSPTSGTFPNTPAGGTSAITFTFTWTASEQGSIGNFQTDGPPFFIQTSTCGPTIAYQGSCKVTLLFGPTVVGSVTGTLTLAYGGSQPGTDQIPLGGTAISHSLICHCAKVSAEFADFKQEPGVYEFRLKWKLHCEGDHRYGHGCEGFLGAGQPTSRPKGLRLRYESGGPHGHRNGGFFCATRHATCAHVDLYCRSRRGTCASRTGEVKVWLIGSAAQRANADIEIRVRLVCVASPRMVENLRLKFDDHGNLDRQASRLGSLN
jgi:hypothetical protein